MELSDFSRVLTHLRKEKGVSQLKAAQALGGFPVASVSL